VLNKIGEKITLKTNEEGAISGISVSVEEIPTLHNVRIYAPASDSEKDTANSMLNRLYEEAKDHFKRGGA